MPTMTSTGRINEESDSEGENIPLADNAKPDEEGHEQQVHEGDTTNDGNKVQETVEDGSGGERDEMNLYLESAYLVNTLKKLAVKLNELENKPARDNRLKEKQTKVKKEIEEILDKRTHSLGMDFKDHNFRTLLHWGCILGNDYMVSLFLEKGADPNCQDKWWNTPLHYATYFCPGVVLKLLEKGAKIWIHNEKYESPLQRISPDTLREYLDGCMHENGRGYDYKAQLDLTFLIPPKESKESKDVEKSKVEESMFAETTCLWWITKSPQHHVVLKHPVITAFLDLKWQQISMIYKLLCIVYMLYLVLLYFFLNAGAFHSMQEARKSMTKLGNETRLGADCTVYQSLQDLESAASSVKDNFTQRLSLDEKAYFQYMPKGWTVVRFVLVAFNSLILFLEFLQLLYLGESIDDSHYLEDFYRYHRRYMHKEKHLLYLTPTTSPQEWENFSLSEVIRIGSQLPFFSLYVHMFITIAVKLLKLIFWSWSVLVIMYSSIFMLLFYTVDEFSSFLLSLSKTITMFIGEFGYENIPFERYGGLSHFAFLTFVIIVTVILMNVLGLADPLCVL
ncbi:unnamed protein product [Darwinula stevensoni]|uniref:Ion transport domain-containing protein n=1 Tax=Darwinula stevensoni TaxID=69355 RepID=A0A7R8X1X4_9CRUS|nr:unnamed protein product [Darwinula stevensoni]CAG0882740.1 unnamed protein product [Darwinula stevensoni]